MKRTIYTLNINNALSSHSRESHLDAAARWGAQYIVLDQWAGSRQDIFGGKLQTHLLSSSGRCMWIDADTLIRSDCPSPFDLVPPDHIGGVASIQDHATNQSLTLTQRSWNEVSSLLNISGTQYNPKTYINTGLVLWTPTYHNHVWKWLDIHAPFRPLGPMVEQTAQNIAIAHRQTPLTLLPPSFNRVGPHVWTHKGTMSDYIYHFANYGKHRGDKHQVINRCNWQIEEPTHAD